MPDGGRDAERQVLGELEGLKVVEDDRLVEPFEGIERGGLEQERMAPCPRGETGDGRGRATDGARDLSMGRAGDKSSGDGPEEFGSFEVVGGREGLAGERAPAREAAEAGDRKTAAVAVRAVAAEPIAGCAAEVLGAASARAERRRERLQPFNGCAGKIHGAEKGTNRAGRAWSRKSFPGNRIEPGWYRSDENTCPPADGGRTQSTATLCASRCAESG